MLLKHGLCPAESLSLIEADTEPFMSRLSAHGVDSHVTFHSGWHCSCTQFLAIMAMMSMRIPH